MFNHANFIILSFILNCKFYYNTIRFCSDLRILFRLIYLISQITYAKIILVIDKFPASLKWIENGFSLLVHACVCSALFNGRFIQCIFYLIV